MVDARSAGLISLEDHERIVDDLTNGVQLAMEKAGQEVLPALEGYVWFNVLKAYAPDKAALFVAKDPIGDILPYAITVVDVSQGKTLTDSAFINHVGVQDLLSQLTDLSANEKIAFFDDLSKTGNAKHYTKEGDEKKFTIFVTNRKKYAMDSRGVLIKLDRFGRATR